MIKSYDDNEETKRKYYDIKKICEELIGFYCDEWKLLKDETGKEVAQYKTYNIGDFHITLFYDYENGKYPAGYDLLVCVEDIDLFHFIYNLNMYYRYESEEKWIDFIHKLYNKLEIDKQAKAQERIKAYNILKDAVGLLCELQNIDVCEYPINKSYNDTRRALNRCGIEVSYSNFQGDVYEMLNRYQPTGGGFRAYYAYYEHELVASCYSETEYDLTEHTTYKPGPWVQELEKIIKEKREQYCDIIRRSHL